MKKIFESSVLNESGNNLEIHVNGKEVNHAIGHGSSNRNMLLRKFGNVRFVTDDSIVGRNLRYEIV